MFSIMDHKWHYNAQKERIWYIIMYIKLKKEVTLAGTVYKPGSFLVLHDEDQKYFYVKLDNGYIYLVKKGDAIHFYPYP